MRILFLTTAIALLPFAGMAATITGSVPDGWTYVGNAGSGTPAGVVTAAPTASGNYTYISTFNAPSGGGTLPAVGGSSTDGSTLTTSVFSAAAGDALKFYFNFVTSDGAGFADYAWVQLLNITGGSDFLMFTARTTPDGNTVPGFGMPDIGAGVTLNPGTVSVTPGGPEWSALGDNSGSCYDFGCGFTGWVESSFTITEAADYQLQFGVSNWSDTAFATGLAIAGATIAGTPIDPNEPSVIPLPAAGWMLLAGLGGLGMIRRRRETV